MLLGKHALQLASSSRVIIFGIGGVGSWCAEGLIRSGIHELTIVDFDHICITNVNRQLHATVNSIGRSKTEALKDRLLAINPSANITAIQTTYTEKNSDSFKLDTYDYIIDAIDSLQHKIHLIRTATKTKAELFSSMGAALRLDPTSVQVAEFWNVTGCPFARRIRKVIRKGELPAKKFFCVFSEKIVESEQFNNTTSEMKDDNTLINGSIAHMTAIFGFTIAGLVIESIYERSKIVELSSGCSEQSN